MKKHILDWDKNTRIILDCTDKENEEWLLNPGMNAGKNLWKGIVKQACDDLKLLIKKARAQKKKHGSVSLNVDYEIKKLFREITNDHFKYICSNADIVHDQLIACINVFLMRNDWKKLKSYRI